MRLSESSIKERTVNQSGFDVESGDIEPGGPASVNTSSTANVDSRLGAFTYLCNHPVFVTRRTGPRGY